jgi:hypothetical protein
MRLRPSEVLVDNLWSGDPDPAPITNRYRGCIATLSNSLQRLAAAEASRRAEEDCLAQGYTTASPGLALCVLSAEQSPAAAAQMASMTVVLTHTPDVQITVSLPKEQRACAELGLNPNDGTFLDCVHGLKNAVAAPLMQDLYK